MRKIFFWFHLTLGTLAGIVILIMSVTGVLLTYEKQMIQWAEARAAKIEPAGNRKPVSELLQTASDRAAGARPASIIIRRAPVSPAEVGMGPGKTALLNPYTGADAGEGVPNLRLFFRKVTLWHRWLGSQEGSRGWQKQVTGASNLAFVFLGMSGLYIWWPRKWTPASRRTAFVPQASLSGKARDFNWHNSMGFWMAIPIIVVAGTATVMSYPWANNLVYTMVGEKPPAPRGGGERGEAKGGEPKGGSAPAALVQARQAPRPEGVAALAQVTERPRRKGDGERRGKGGGRRPRTEVAQSQVAPGARGESREGRGVQAAFTTEGLDDLFQRAASTNANWQTITMRFQGPRIAIQVDGGTGGQPQLRETLTYLRNGELIEREGFANLTLGRQIRNYMRFLHTGEALGVVGQTVAGLASLVGVVLVWTGLSLAIRRLWAWNNRRNSPVRETVEAEKTLTTA